MNSAQALACALLAGAVIVFAWGRFRYDVVALVALVIAMATGDVAPKDAFTGFTGDVVVIIASALVVSAAIARSGFIEWAVYPITRRLHGASSQVPALAGLTAVLSMLTKNVGALAIMMPVALRMARRTGTSPSSLLMPMAFMSLLGGLVILVGTSTNIIVSQVREEMLGKPFGMYDFAPVGLVLTGLGFVFVSFGWRLLPRNRQGRRSLAEVAVDAEFATEAKVPESLPEGLATIADLKLNEAGVTLRAVVDPDGKRRMPLPDLALVPGLVLVLAGDDDALDRLFARTPLEQARDVRALEREDPHEEMRSVEAVVQPESLLVGRSAQRSRLESDFGVQLLGLRRSGARIVDRLRDLTLRPGDVLVLRAGERALPVMMAELGLLPLVERMVKLGDHRRRFMPIMILAVAMALVTLKIVPVAGAFFGAAVAMIVVGALSSREAYAALEPEVLVLIGALTPLSEAVHHTGATGLIAHQLASLLIAVPPLVSLLAVMGVAMICSPFLHNAPTVLVLAPIAVSVAKGLELNPDPFLMAVATGAGCDFLTPIGHQCNTLVMGPGGYRFSDYWRLGLPLSLLVLLVGSVTIQWVWPLV